MGRLLKNSSCQTVGQRSIQHKKKRRKGKGFQEEECPKTLRHGSVSWCFFFCCQTAESRFDSSDVCHNRLGVESGALDRPELQPVSGSLLRAKANGLARAQNKM